jgi:hypothetical protein
MFEPSVASVDEIATVADLGAAGFGVWARPAAAVMANAHAASRIRLVNVMGDSPGVER